MGNIIETIKAVAALDKAVTPTIANMVTKGLENKTDEEAMDTLMGIAAPLRGLLEAGLKSMGYQITPIVEDEEDNDDDYYPDEEEDIEIQVNDDEDNWVEKTIQFLRNVQVALALDREDLYKLLLIMGVEGITPTNTHGYVTEHFNEWF